MCSSSYFFLPLALPFNVRKTHIASINLSFQQAGIWQLESKHKGRNKLLGFRHPCIVEPFSRVQAISDGTDDYDILVSDVIKERVGAVKSMLDSMGDGEINVSAYDTAWVALVKDMNGSGGPQFPSCLQWIADNQLPDGSWGESQIFNAYDRLLNTLACVVALKSWNIHYDQFEKGLKYFKENISELEEQDEEASEQMLMGFEVAFPSLLELAGRLGIDIPFDSPVFQDICARKNLKLAKIPKDVMHNVPTTLLYSLEGMVGIELDWEKLIKLQNQDGSFLTSPASTAYALMNTKDENCLKFLNNTIKNFNGGVPCLYPIDIFEQVWAIDRLQRLGLSRYFQREIKTCLDYVSTCWSTKYGSSWARNNLIYDIDCTCMTFRILRLHGYNVSTGVFHHFEKGGEFFCFAGQQSTHSLTVTFNLYRATQVMFPGENILQEAKHFSYNFLREKQAASKLLDKWVMLKDFSGELDYALEIPWYASLPRVETRFYIEYYGGGNDIWIGKTLYRLPNVNNNVYLELAKLDFNNSQALHRMEWDSVQKWFVETKLDDFGMSKTTLLVAYFLAAANIFEPERSAERFAWAKTAFLMETISNQMYSKDHRRAFVQEFQNINESRRGHINGSKTEEDKCSKQKLVSILFMTLNQLSLASSGGNDISPYLCCSWEKWMIMWEEEGDMYHGAAELLVNTINFSSGKLFFLNHPSYQKLVNLSNRVCHQLGLSKNQKAHCKGRHNSGTMEADMQQLVQAVLPSDDIDPDVKHTFFAVVRSFYYAACCDQRTVNFHIAKVLFEAVH